MTPDKTQPYYWPHNAGDRSRGLIYNHQAIGKGGSKIKPSLVATIANFLATKDITNPRDLIGLLNRSKNHNPDLQHTMTTWQLLLKKSNKFVWSASRRDGTRCYSMARPPEDDANLSNLASSPKSLQLEELSKLKKLSIEVNSLFEVVEGNFWISSLTSTT